MRLYRLGIQHRPMTLVTRPRDIGVLKILQIQHISAIQFANEFQLKLQQMWVVNFLRGLEGVENFQIKNDSLEAAMAIAWLLMVTYTTGILTALAKTNIHFQKTTPRLIRGVLYHYTYHHIVFLAGLI